MILTLAMVVIPLVAFVAVCVLAYLLSNGRRTPPSMPEPLSAWQ